MRLALGVTLVFLFLTGAANAESPVIEQQFRSAAPNADLEDLLYLDAGVALSRAGYSSAHSASAPVYRLVVDYLVTPSEVEFHFQLRSPPGEVLAETSVALPLDDRIDATLTETVAQLLSQAGVEGDGTEESHIDGLFARPAPPEPEPSSRFDGWMAGGGTVYFGKWSEVARFAATAELDLGWWLGWEAVSLWSGLRVGGTKAFNNAGVTGGTLYPSVAAAVFEVGTGRSQATRFWAGLGAGAAVLTVAGDDVLSKTVPYADAEVRAEFLLPGRFTLGVALRYAMMFDPDVFVSGLTPLISLGKEF